LGGGVLGCGCWGHLCTEDTAAPEMGAGLGTGWCLGGYVLGFAR
jgi:hypothetical protein